jgi:hypothetical protein
MAEGPEREEQEDGEQDAEPEEAAVGTQHSAADTGEDCARVPGSLVVAVE